MKIGFIGAGNMGSSILGGILRNGIASPDDIMASCRTEKSRRSIEERFGVHAMPDNCVIACESDVLFLAVRPGTLDEVIEEIRNHVAPDTIIVSVVAGRSLSSLEAAFDSSDVKHKIVQVMPNTPALVGEGMTAVIPNDQLTEEDIETVMRLMESFGKAEIISDKMIDPFTALAGCAPAMMFMIIESMADYGVRAGFTKMQAAGIAAQAMKGAAEMVLDTGMHPAELKDMVCTPGGDTIIGIHDLEKTGLRSTIIEGMRSFEHACAGMDSEKAIRG